MVEPKLVLRLALVIVDVALLAYIIGSGVALWVSYRDERQGEDYDQVSD